MTQNTAKPQSFSDIFYLHSISCLGNETVRLLYPDVKAQIQVIDELAQMKQTKFINLVKHQDDARIAMALYAGDGIVTKITPQGYGPTDPLPFVLPALTRRRVEGTERSGEFIIENFPCLTVSQSEQDVKTMRGLLAGCGLVFAEQDDRPGNIGIMPDGSLAILDGNAVRMGNAERAVVAAQLKTWNDKISHLYPELYAPGYSYQQSPATNYTVQSYRNRPVAAVTQGTIQRTSVPARPRWLSRVLGPAVLNAVT